MRLAVDATPLLGQRSGVGRYLTGLLDGLAELPEQHDVLLTLFSIRGAVPPPLPAGTRAAPRRAPARALRPLWRRLSFPPVEALTGRVDVFHGTNFVLPPTLRAAGVVTIHDLAYLRFPETVTGDAAAYRHLVPQALRRCGQVVAVTRAMADEITEEYGLPPDLVTVAHHGVDPEWSRAAPMSEADLDRLRLPREYLLFTGNLEPRKNLGTLVRAHAAARRADKGIPPLLLVGPSGWGDRWQGDPPDPSDVVLAGYFDDATLRGVVAGATAVCMPSHYEGFGLPVLEALAAGRPVVASDIPAHREVAGRHVRLLPATDVDAWSQALLDALTGDIGGIAEDRRAHARTFTWGVSAQAHLKAYDRARLR